MLKRPIAAVRHLFAIMTALALPALAGPIAVGGPWYEFSFGAVGSNAGACTSCFPSSGGNSVFADGSPWTFTASAGGAVFIVTDAFGRGDSFNVFDFGSFISTTPTVSASDNNCDDPAVCVLDPSYSHGLFNLGPGPHSLSITMFNSPFGGGAAYFRADAVAVPEP